ncbi:DUF883 family protein [Sphingosinicella microcystinivorans]|uniref:ElaB/YqjD/DUF883 family membrane-anchored ribosome-binding protein n=1 Tax=Sphingosinicella microcystinivorans TaxID=335406 RepID=A0AAD1D8X3_SPHMI|nr:DUF883 family protein [Sphingosinicella microcystinivorans]RKS91980.1 ElaB/YqjD/DUF883 family membrane-anchored ribosome-binding protein [Sphingosinicella microcystinivorans]BBE34966.1 hypothetical protein SmB9_26240 [Sphingosinicella microcystinivorans]
MNDDPVNTALYEAEAAEARRRIALTVGEIRHRLDPRTIANEAIDAAAERGAELVARGRQAARENLGAISIVGALAGMLAGARHNRKSRKAPAMSEYEDDFGNEAPGKDRLDSVKQTAQQVRETVTHKAQAARDVAGEKLASARQHANDAWETARERAADYSERAKIQAAKARERTVESVEENPITAVLAGAALGAIIGALLPRSSSENRTIGPVRDKLASTARTAARVARTAGEAKLAELGIKEAAKLRFNEIKEGAAEVAKSATTAVRSKGKTVNGTNPEDEGPAELA